MKKHLPKLVVLAVMILAAVAWRFFFMEENSSGLLMVSGSIEVTDVQLGFRIPGTLETCLVDEGDTVSKGRLLAQLEDNDQQLALDLAKAGLTQARARLAELEAGSRPQEITLAHAKVRQFQQALLEMTRGSRKQEIETARAELEKALAELASARAHLDQAKEDYERFSILYRKKTATQRDFQLYRTQYDVAQNKVAQAESLAGAARQTLSLVTEGPRAEQIEKTRALLAQAEAEYALVKAGPRKEIIAQAQAGVSQAMLSVDQAKQQVFYTRLSAPMDGVVLTRSAEPGEFLNPAMPVVTLGALARPWLRAYINETDLGRIHLMDTVTVTTDSFPDKQYQGVVSFISSQAEFTPKTVQTFEERVKLMFRIKIDLANPHGELKPGMPADAVFSVSETQDGS